jgi:hypothetical protein
MNLSPNSFNPQSVSRLPQPRTPAPPARDPSFRSPPVAPPFPSTYKDLIHCRLPEVDGHPPSSRTHGYSGLHPAHDPPKFMYQDRGLPDEAKQRFNEAINEMEVADRSLPAEAHTLWQLLCDEMLTGERRPEDWVGDIAGQLLRLVGVLLKDALGSMENWVRAFVAFQAFQPPIQYSQQGDKTAVIRYQGTTISHLACEWKTSTVLLHHMDDLGRVQLLPGGPLEGGRAIAIKVFPPRHACHVLTFCH